MSIPYTAGGRTAQKSRTHRALVDAARALIAGGTTPTVEEAAAAAGISRTTAYRYFPGQRELLLEAYPIIETPSLLPEHAPADAEHRLALVMERLMRMLLDNEQALRTAVRLSLEDPKGTPSLLRRGRAVAWIDEALEPVRGKLGARDTSRLAKAIRAIAGIEALVWLTDVGKMPRREAVDLMKWAAGALLQSAMQDGITPPGKRARRSMRRKPISRG